MKFLTVIFISFILCGCVSSPLGEYKPRNLHKTPPTPKFVVSGRGIGFIENQRFEYEGKIPDQLKYDDLTFYRIKFSFSF